MKNSTTEAQEFEGRLGGSGQRKPAKGSGKSRVQESCEEMQSKVRSSNDKHPMTSGKSNRA